MQTNTQSPYWRLEFCCHKINAWAGEILHCMKQAVGVRSMSVHAVIWHRVDPPSHLILAIFRPGVSVKPDLSTWPLMAAPLPPTLTSCPHGPLWCQSIELQPSQTDKHINVMTSLSFHSKVRATVFLKHILESLFILLTDFKALDSDIIKNSNKTNTHISMHKISKLHAVPCQRAVKL